MKSSLVSMDAFDLLKLAGEIDLHYSPQVREQILASLKAGRPLLIDLSGVSYIDSSGIASLVEGFQTAKTARLGYGLLNISSTTLQVLTLTRLDKIFALYDSPESFCAGLKG
jgi:anti-sigma B factor antagonist